MDKKVYVKPTVVTHIVALGVFGNYNNGGGEGGDDVPPLPIRIVTDHKLRME